MSLGGGTPETGAGARRRGWIFAVPALAVMAGFSVPLLLGERTLILRNVLLSHLGLRAALADALRSGELPLVDPLRAGGMPLAGNPNTVAFYPDNLLLLVGSNLWQLNLHFVLHWAVAFAGAWALGRAWGLTRAGAIAGASVYCLSGYWLSQMSLYNAVAVVALAPALWAILLDLGRGHRRGGAALLAVVWGLMLSGGEPLVAGIAVVPALAVAVARNGRSWPWRRAGAALVLGTLLAAPQWIETARILPDSARAVHGFESAHAGQRDPRTAVELVLPLFFGRPDVAGGWGEALYGGQPALYVSLFPGFVALLLALVAGAPVRREARWLAALAALALAVTFSGGTALPEWINALPGGSLFRYFEKAFLPVALALALAAGTGFDRVLEGRAAGRIVRAASILVAAPLGLWLLLGTDSARIRSGFDALFANVAPAGLFDAERLRWSGTAMFVVATLAIAALAAAFARPMPRGAAALLLTVHVGSQAFFLRSLLATDESAAYRGESPVAAAIPQAAVLAHGETEGAFGTGLEQLGLEELPDARQFWRLRRARSELRGFGALHAGRRTELFLAPEGLDPFAAGAFVRTLATLDDTARVAALRAIGVERLILPRALVPADAGGARSLGRFESLGREVEVYELPNALAEAVVAGDVIPVGDPREALAVLLAPGFDPRRAAVVVSSMAPRRGPPGTVRTISERRERLELETDSPDGGVLILRRAHLSLWRARIDGRPVPTLVGQATRLAVEVPPGRHRVELFVERRTLWIGLLLAVAAATTIYGIHRRERRRVPLASAGGSG